MKPNRQLRLTCPRSIYLESVYTLRPPKLPTDDNGDDHNLAIHISSHFIHMFNTTFFGLNSCFATCSGCWQRDRCRLRVPVINVLTLAIIETVCSTALLNQSRTRPVFLLSIYCLNITEQRRRRRRRQPRDDCKHFRAGFGRDSLSRICILYGIRRSDGKRTDALNDSAKLQKWSR